MSAEFLDLLRRVLPPDALLTEPEQLAPYESDALTAYHQLPLAVALPYNEIQVAEVLRVCNRYHVPVVARGHGTGLSGGALPVKGGLVLSLARLNKILSIDPVARTAKVQPGVRNLAISEAVAKHGLYYAPDPSSQIACSIGGNVAENSGGIHCLKYGLTVHNIMQLRVITIAGEILTIGSQALDAPGYDLLALMTGSEGMLGVMVEITVRLLPRPERAQVLLAAFDSVEKAGIAVGEIIAAGIIPAGLEMMDKLAIHASEQYVHADYPLNAAAILLVEIDGANEEVSDGIRIVHDVAQACGATEIRTATDDKQRARLWAGRKAAFPAMGRISPDYYCMDGTIPRKQLPYVLKRIAELSAEYGLRVANVFHAGDGNLHPLILYDANVAGELLKTEALGGKILQVCLEAGGSITGEHGVGIEKINQMCEQFATPELEIFHALKSAFDPQDLLNPGKAVPSLHRCAELGAMHVHGGNLPHPELPRF